jgi:hypothetical protein
MLFALIVISSACSREVERRQDQPAPPTTIEPRSAETVVAALKKVPGLDVDFEARDRFDTANDGSTHPASAPAGEGRLRARLPHDAAGAIHLAIEGDESLSVDLVAQEARPAGASIVAAATVFLDGAVDTDVVHVVGGGRVEEVRWLRTPRASSITRYAMQLGEGVGAVRIVSGSVEILDRHGVARIASAPMYAVDAKGVRRAVKPELSGDREHLVLSTSLDTAGLAYPIAVDPAWVATGDMVNGYRYLHGQVTLGTGKVVIFGGYVPLSGIELSTAELYDPALRTWSSTGALTTGRQRMGFALLADGRVLAAGGKIVGAIAASIEIYDPATAKWTTFADMHDTRDAPAVTVLADGRVLVAGGGQWSPPSLATAELYTPSTNTWTVTTSMGTPRQGTVAMLQSARLSSGRVLVLGGTNETIGASTDLNTAEVYDPVGKTWTPTATAMQGPISRAIALPGRDVLAVSSTGQADVYDETTNAFHSVSASPVGAVDSLTLLSTGKVLAIGTNGKYAIYDPASSTWNGTGSLLLKRSSAGVSRMASGSVLVSGGGYLTTLPPLAEVFTQSANGAACAGGYECTSGFCADGVCCGVASCGTGKSCNAGTPGVCVKTNGTACSGGTECGSGNCADGVCCDTACTGICSSCNTVGKAGTCSPVSGAPVGGRPACSGAGVGTACAPFCNGIDGSACSYTASGVTPCGADSCATGTEVHAGTCNGAGACATISKPCGAYACGATACKTSCSVVDDCAPGYFCNAGACQAVAGLGAPCSSPAECKGGTYCTDGVCCGVPSCGAGRSCAVTTTPGTCGTKNGEVCTADAECGSAYCTDGVCCDKRCDGQCEACDVAGKKGACTPIAGAPHPGRTACFDGGGDACKATTCDGAKNTKICSGYVNGPTMQCNPSSCAAASYTAPSTCDGLGACAKPVATSCFPYGCDEHGCLSSCTSAAQCADGADCKAGKCTAQGDTCAPDGRSSIAKGGTVTPCAPFVCGSDGKCNAACGTSSDCAPGLTCDESQHCVDAGGGSGGGCAIGGDVDGAYLALALGMSSLCAAGARRRRGSGRAGR